MAKYTRRSASTQKTALTSLPTPCLLRRVCVCVLLRESDEILNSYLSRRWLLGKGFNNLRVILGLWVGFRNRA